MPWWSALSIIITALYDIRQLLIKCFHLQYNRNQFFDRKAFIVCSTAMTSIAEESEKVGIQSKAI